MGGGGCCVECECEGADRPGWSRATIITLEKRVTFLSAVCGEEKPHAGDHRSDAEITRISRNCQKPQLGPITQINCENIFHMHVITKWTLGSSEWNNLDQLQLLLLVHVHVPARCAGMPPSYIEVLAHCTTTTMSWLPCRGS